MHTEKYLAYIVTAASVTVAFAQSADPSAITYGYNILKVSEAEQVAYIKSTLDRGFPPDDTLPVLVLNRSDLALPLMEKKIEDVLNASSPGDLFTEKSVDAQRFVAVTAATIAYAGNQQALRQIGKLLAIDEKRFDDLVRITLINAETFRNPFPVAYQGFAIGDPALDKRIAAWAESQFADKLESRIRDLKRMWAEAMVQKYGGVPSEAEWRTDPFAVRLRVPRPESLHDDMIRLTSQIVERGGKK